MGADAGAVCFFANVGDVQYKKHVKELMSKGASRLTGGKRVRLLSDEGEEADRYELNVLTEYIDGDPNYALVFFGQLEQHPCDAESSSMA